MNDVTLLCLHTQTICIFLLMPCFLLILVTGTNVSMLPVILVMAFKLVLVLDEGTFNSSLHVIK